MFDHHIYLHVAYDSMFLKPYKVVWLKISARGRATPGFLYVGYRQIFSEREQGVIGID